jgi:hypothetical protein
MSRGRASNHREFSTADYIRSQIALGQASVNPAPLSGPLPYVSVANLNSGGNPGLIQAMAVPLLGIDSTFAIG